MNLTFAITSIIVITVLMILAMFLRAKSREGTSYYAIDFCHEGHCWKIVVRMARFWRVLYARVVIKPGDLLSFRPQLAYNVQKNGRVIAARPNFWSDYAALALCKAAKRDVLTMEIEIVFKDLKMARAFEEALLQTGHNTDRIITRHNKITFELPAP